MRRFALGFAVVLLLFGAFVAGATWGRRDLLEGGTFVVLLLTLIALIIYAFDTNTMARVTRERWKREGVLETIYEMGISDAKGAAGRTVFRIQNPSRLMVRARVACNFQVYGSPVKCSPPYDGDEIWFVFPQQLSQGWFEIDPLLRKKGKAVAAMIAEQTPGNTAEQLTMDLEIEFRDELSERRKLPSRRHYFDFGQWTWVPVLTKPTWEG